jgi:hypothetical protein
VEPTPTVTETETVTESPAPDQPLMVEPTETVTETATPSPAPASLSECSAQTPCVVTVDGQQYHVLGVGLVLLVFAGFGVLLAQLRRP